LINIELTPAVYFRFWTADMWLLFCNLNYALHYWIEWILVPNVDIHGTRCTSLLSVIGACLLWWVLTTLFWSVFFIISLMSHSIFYFVPTHNNLNKHATFSLFTMLRYNAKFDHSGHLKELCWTLVYFNTWTLKRNLSHSTEYASQLQLNEIKVNRLFPCSEGHV
jgi:hypothetical protein